MITFFTVNGILLAVAVLLLLAEKFFVSYGECSVAINGGRKIEVSGGDSLLSYLNKEKIFIPSACGGKATCGFCRVKVLSGGGNILPTEEVYITGKEREEGMRLACQVKVKENIDIYIPEYILGAKEFEAEVEFVKDMTHDIKMVRLRVLQGGAVGFKPGQYIQFKIPGTDEYRAYSVANAPYEEGIIELIIRLVPGGLCSNYVHKALEKNDRVVFTGPFGDFYLREDSEKDIVAIGGGSGMAPMRSIIYYLAGKGMPRRLSYFFGARTKKDLFFTEEFRELERKYPNFKYYPALSEPSRHDRWEGEVGFVTHTAEKYIDAEMANEAYLCGPPPMVNAAQKVLAKKKIMPDNTYYDKF